MSTKKKDLVKIRFATEWLGDWGFGGENMWAKVLGYGEYEVQNIPTFVYGVSLGDVVDVERDGDGFLNVTKVVRRGNQNTYRLIVKATERTFEKRRDALIDTIREFFPEKDLGIEGGFGTMLSLSVVSARSGALDLLLALLKKTGRIEGYELSSGDNGEVD